jgi:hypothetical protein
MKGREIMRKIVALSIVFVMLAILGVSTSFADNEVSTEKIKVLHVYVVMQNEVQQTIDAAGATDDFTVTQVSLGDFNAGAPANLAEYDVVVFGISDSYEDAASYGPISRTSELKEYVKNGGGIVFTHDSLEVTNDYPELEEIAGVGVDYAGTWIGYTEVKIVQDHEVLHNLFEIGNVGDLKPVDETHTSGGQITTASPIIRFSNAGEEPDNFYLTTHEYGSGRVVVDEIGHSYPKIAGTEESQIFCNSLYWAGNGNKVTGGCTEDDSGALDIGGTKAKIGEEVQIPVKIQNAPNDVYSFGFEVTYDTSVLEYVDVVPVDLAKSFDTIEAYLMEPGKLRIGGYTDKNNISQGASGYLVWLKFKVIDGQVSNCYSLQLDNLQDHIADFSKTGGCFCVWECNGDLNGDNEVTAADALIALRCYLGSGACPDCSDADKNGMVTPLDALCIFRKYLGEPSCLD